MTILFCKNAHWENILHKVKNADLFFSQRFAGVFPGSSLFLISLPDEGVGIFPFLSQDGAIHSFRYGGILTDRQYPGAQEAINGQLKELCKSSSLRRVIIRVHPFMPVYAAGKMVKKEPFV